jgi:hypothetical protein
MACMNKHRRVAAVSMSIHATPPHPTSPPCVTHTCHHKFDASVAGDLWGAVIQKLSELASDVTSMPSISDAAKLYALVGKDNKAGIAHANVLQQLVRLSQQEGQVRIVQQIVDGCRSPRKQQQQQQEQQEQQQQDGSATAPAAGGRTSPLLANTELELVDAQQMPESPRQRQGSSQQPQLCARLSEASKVLSGMLTDLPAEAVSICQLLKAYEGATPGYADTAFCCYMATAAQAPLVHEGTSSAQVTAVVQLLKAADLGGALHDELFELPAR